MKNNRPPCKTRKEKKLTKQEELKSAKGGKFAVKDSSGCQTNQVTNQTGKRNVEASCYRTETHTELSVEYSLNPEENVDFDTKQSGNFPLFSQSDVVASVSRIPKIKISENSSSFTPTDKDLKDLDKHYITKILQKLYLARKNLSPVIDEIINSATKISATEIAALKYSKSPLCSVTTKQISDAIKASKMFQEVSEELNKKNKNKTSLIVGETFRFPCSYTVMNMMVVPNEMAETDRIYIDKDLMLQLIEVYELLGKTIERLKQYQRDQEMPRNHMEFVEDDLDETMKEIDDRLSPSPKANNPSAGYVEEPPPNKAFRNISAGAVQTLEAPASKQSCFVEPKKKPKVRDVETAKQNLLECLTELAEIRQFFTENVDEKVDITSQIILTKSSTDESCCERKNIPHLHALLNGVPVVLKLNKDVLKSLALDSTAIDSELPEDNVISVSVISKRPDENIIVTVEEYEKDGTKPVNDATITISNTDSPIAVKSKTGVQYVEKDVYPYTKTVVVTLPNPDLKQPEDDDYFVPEERHLKSNNDGKIKRCQCDWTSFTPCKCSKQPTSDKAPPIVEIDEEEDSNVQKEQEEMPISGNNADLFEDETPKGSETSQPKEAETSSEHSSAKASKISSKSGGSVKEGSPRGSKSSQDKTSHGSRASHSSRGSRSSQEKYSKTLAENGSPKGSKHSEDKDGNDLDQSPKNSRSSQDKYITVLEVPQDDDTEKERAKSPTGSKTSQEERSLDACNLVKAQGKEKPNRCTGTTCKTCSAIRESYKGDLIHQPCKGHQSKDNSRCMESTCRTCQSLRNQYNADLTNQPCISEGTTCKNRLDSHTPAVSIGTLGIEGKSDEKKLSYPSDNNYMPVDATSKDETASKGPEDVKPTEPSAQTILPTKKHEDAEYYSVKDAEFSDTSETDGLKNGEETEPNADEIESFSKGVTKTSSPTSADKMHPNEPASLHRRPSKSAFTSPSKLKNMNLSVTVIPPPKCHFSCTTRFAEKGVHVVPPCQNFELQTEATEKSAVKKEDIEESEVGVTLPNNGISENVRSHPNTKESEPNLPYTVSTDSIPNAARKRICSSLDFDVNTVYSTLRDEGISHPNESVARKLQELGVENLLKASRPAKCCRKTVLNEKMQNHIPYPASLMSLPLSDHDIAVIGQTVKMSQTTDKKDTKEYKAYLAKLEYYTNLDPDTQKFSRVAPTYQVMYFEVQQNNTQPKKNSNSVDLARNDSCCFPDSQTYKRDSKKKRFNLELPNVDVTACNFLVKRAKKKSVDSGTDSLPYIPVDTFDKDADVESHPYYAASSSNQGSFSSRHRYRRIEPYSKSKHYSYSAENSPTRKRSSGNASSPNYDSRNNISMNDNSYPRSFSMSETPRQEEIVRNLSKRSNLSGNISKNQSKLLSEPWAPFNTSDVSLPRDKIENQTIPEEPEKTFKDVALDPINIPAASDPRDVSAAADPMNDVPEVLGPKDVPYESKRRSLPQIEFKEDPDVFSPSERSLPLPNCTCNDDDEMPQKDPSEFSEVTARSCACEPLLPPKDTEQSIDYRSETQGCVTQTNLGEGRRPSHNINVEELVKQTEAFYSKIESLNDRYASYLIGEENCNFDDFNIKHNTSETNQRKSLFPLFCVSPVYSEKTFSPFKNEKCNCKKKGAWVKKEGLIRQSLNLLGNKIDQRVNKQRNSDNSASTWNENVPTENNNTSQIQSKQFVKEEIMEFTIAGKEHVSIIVKIEKSLQVIKESNVPENCKEFSGQYSKNANCNNVNSKNQKTLVESKSCGCQTPSKKKVVSRPNSLEELMNRIDNLLKGPEIEKTKSPLPTNNVKKDDNTQEVAQGLKRLSSIPEEKAEDVSDKSNVPDIKLPESQPASEDEMKPETACICCQCEEEPTACGDGMEQPKPEEIIDSNTPKEVSKSCQCISIENSDKDATANFEEEPELCDQEVQAKTSFAGNGNDDGCQCPDLSELQSCECPPERAKAKRTSKEQSYKVYSLLSLRRSQKAFYGGSQRRAISVNAFQKKEDEQCEFLNFLESPDSFSNNTEASASVDNSKSVSDENEVNIRSCKKEEVEVDIERVSTELPLKIHGDIEELSKTRVSDIQAKTTFLSRNQPNEHKTFLKNTAGCSKVLPTNLLAKKSFASKVKTPYTEPKMPPRHFSKTASPNVSKIKQISCSKTKNDDYDDDFIALETKPNVSFLKTDSCTLKKAYSSSRVDENIMVIHENKTCEEPAFSSSVISDTECKNGYFYTSQNQKSSNFLKTDHKKLANNDSILDLVETIKYSFAKTENDSNAMILKNVVSETESKPSPKISIIEQSAVKHQPFFLVPQNRVGNLCDNILNLYPFNWSIPSNNQPNYPQFAVQNRTYANHMAFIYPQSPKYPKNAWVLPISSIEPKLLHKNLARSVALGECCSSFCNPFQDRILVPLMSRNVCHSDCSAQTDEIISSATISFRKGLGRSTKIMVYQGQEIQQHGCKAKCMAKRSSKEIQYTAVKPQKPKAEMATDTKTDKPRLNTQQSHTQTCKNPAKCPVKAFSQQTDLNKYECKCPPMVSCTCPPELSADASAKEMKNCPAASGGKGSNSEKRVEEKPVGVEKQEGNLGYSNASCGCSPKASEAKVHCAPPKSKNVATDYSQSPQPREEEKQAVATVQDTSSCICPSDQSANGEDPQVCYALTKVNVYDDGTREFEILEVSSTPPGQYIISDKNNLILIGEQPSYR